MTNADNYIAVQSWRFQCAAQYISIAFSANGNKHEMHIMAPVDRAFSVPLLSNFSLSLHDNDSRNDPSFKSKLEQPALIFFSLSFYPFLFALFSLNTRYNLDRIRYHCNVLRNRQKFTTVQKPYTRWKVQKAMCYKAESCISHCQLMHLPRFAKNRTVTCHSLSFPFLISFFIKVDENFIIKRFSFGCLESVKISSSFFVCNGHRIN